jgi:hypothetical protein
MSSTDNGIPIAILIVALFIILILVSTNIQVNGQVRCPNGSHRSPLGDCERLSSPDIIDNNTMDSNTSQSLSLEQVTNKTQSSPIASNESLTYDDPLLGFRFQYPQNWKNIIDENIAGTGVAFSLFHLVESEYPHDISGLHLYIKNVPENKTLKQHMMELISKYIDHQSLKYNEIKLSGIPAINASWTLSDKNVILQKSLLNFAIKDNVAYIIDYDAGPEVFGKWLPQVNNIIKSFQITG